MKPVRRKSLRDRSSNQPLGKFGQWVSESLALWIRVGLSTVQLELGTSSMVMARSFFCRSQHHLEVNQVPRLAQYHGTKFRSANALFLPPIEHTP